MTKRRDVLKKISKAAAAAGVAIEQQEGGNHTLILLDGLRIPVGRHNELDNLLVVKIYKECEPKLGKDWWK